MSIEVVVDAPPLSPPPNGLLQSAQVIPHKDTGEDARWINGLRLEPEANGPIVRLDVSCAGEGVDNSDSARHRAGVGTFYPFGVEGYDQCSTFGWERADYEGRALRTLAAWETIGVEAQLDDGAIEYEGHVANPHFQDAVNTVAITTGTAVGLRHALQLAVQAIADHNLGMGMIHARPGVVTGWATLNVLQRVGNKLYTLGGQLVVPGYGYSGKAPDGTAPTASAEWVYVTEYLQIHQGEVETWVDPIGMQNVDRTNNNVESRAQRANLIASNKLGIFGVEVDPTTV